jgi:5-formyltetrahydrofolate cyclo-ligase
MDLPTDLDEQKAAMRTAAQARRRLAHQSAHGHAHGHPHGAGEAARDHFTRAGLHRDARGRVAGIAAGYRPIRSELDPTPLMLALLGAGCRLCVPVIEGRGLPLRFREWSPGARMMPGTFGTQVPAEGDWLEPDLLVVPCLAFDAAGRRLGYGGGFYDRTLARLRAGGGPVRAIGFGYAAQEVEAVPADEADQPLDAIVTEAGVIRPVAPARAPA